MRRPPEATGEFRAARRNEDRPVKVPKRRAATVAKGLEALHICG
jgi:hypothetical protein